jgi:hypothetical protein
VSRWLSVLFLAGLQGCTGAPPQPASAAARTPSPGSVTRDNPAGDAASPIDAALTRLLQQPIAWREDKFETLRPRFADADNWRRMRFFGYPTRAAFRYGKDRYATVVIQYTEAEDDSPAACVEAFVSDAARTAERFDVEVGDMEREMRTHKRGVEALDFAELAAAEKRWEQDTQRQRDKLREEVLRGRARVAEERRKLFSARMVLRPLMSREPPLVCVAPTRACMLNGRSYAAEVEFQRLHARLRRAERLLFLAHKPPPHPLGVLLARAGDGDMPLVRTRGEMRTLAVEERHLVAVAAYQSWPGTCLVQAFAVKVGTDERLAERVRERWIQEMAPALEWRPELRAKPPIEDR